MGKKKRKAHKQVKINKVITEKNKTCPKCGPGVYMAKHKDRVHCGRCGYMERK